MPLSNRLDKRAICAALDVRHARFLLVLILLAGASGYGVLFLWPDSTAIRTIRLVPVVAGAAVSLATGSEYAEMERISGRRMWLLSLSFTILCGILGTSAAAIAATSAPWIISVREAASLAILATGLAFGGALLVGPTVGWVPSALIVLWLTQASANGIALDTPGLPNLAIWAAAGAGAVGWLSAIAVAPRYLPVEWDPYRYSRFTRRNP